VEVRNGFSQWFLQIDQHILEVTEGFTTAESALWVYFLFCNSVRNEDTHTPVEVVSILVVGLSGAELAVGPVVLKGMGLATVVGMAMSICLLILQKTGVGNDQLKKTEV